ncbi:hypothetical protein IL306_014206 [Fusarium sp. DS 682]|nr:hypothetical protein IL306_014206 [Fusarium sp. DS 682]
MAMFGANNETDFWDDFANNFATDLAPIIALFGEQVTKQFLSESTTILDVIIFAVGPLGIITAVVSCIRVSNSTFLKSIIGRAREPHGMPEVELCSSTSENVCELWSNGGICRVFGRPKILEFMYKKPSDPREYQPSFDSPDSEIPAKCGIESTGEFFDNLKSESQVRSELSELVPIVIKQDQKREGSWRSVSSSELLRLPFSSILSKLHKRAIKTNVGSETCTENDIEGGIVENTPEEMTKATRDHNRPTDKMQTQVLRAKNKGPKQAEEKRQGDSHVDIDRNFAPFPNLALNIGGPRPSKAVLGLLGLWSAAIFGVLLQASFFVYATWATKYKASFYEDKRTPRNSSWFVLTIAGTSFIVVGMALCAQVIDDISEERRFVFHGTEKPRMFWLQPGGQRIGDQEFDGFAYNQIKTDYVTSWKRREHTSGCYWRVWLAVAFSIGGWVMQFVGLRGIHGTIALYQLALTIIMSIIRGCLRSCNAPSDNQLSSSTQDMAGHELDWQAMKLAKNDNQQPEADRADFWFIDDRRVDKQDTSSQTLYGYGFEEVYWNDSTKNIFLTRDSSGTRAEARKFVEWIESREPEYWLHNNTQATLKELRPLIRPKGSNAAEPPQIISSLPQPAVRLIRIRSRLAFLTDHPLYQLWDSDIRDMAGRLKASLQRAGRIITTGKLLGPVGDSYKSIVWSIGCQLTKDWHSTGDVSGEQPICLHMYRAGDTWNIDEYQLEAILGLWLWSFQKWRCRHRGKLPSGIKPFAVHWKTTHTLSILLERWGVEPRHEFFMTLPMGQQSDLSVPTIMSLQPIEYGDSESAMSRRMLQADISSIDSTASILNLMAQDIFTLFLKRISIVLDSNLANILYPNLDGPAGPATSLIDDLAEVLVAERLATHEEAIMTILPGLYQDSAFLYPLPFQLISAANSLKRQNKFDESERILQRLIETGYGSVKGLAQQTLCELYRSELRYMRRNPRIFTASELWSKAERMRQRITTFHSYKQAYCYREVIDRILALATTEVQVSSTLQRQDNEPRQPLTEETLARLDLDNSQQLYQSRQDLTKLRALALTLADEYDIGTSDIQVRKQLLRWAIERDCCGLVEDLWSSEQHLSRTESVFGPGSDELFWALLASDYDELATMLFLLDVAQVSATEGLKQKDQMEKAWWSTSQLQGYVREGYKQYDCILTVASSGLRGLEYVQLLAGKRTWGLERLHEAVLSALDTGNLETVEYLYSKTWSWAQDGTGSSAPLAKLLETASRWGLTNSVEVLLTGKRNATVAPLKKEDIEAALEAAQKGLRDPRMERAREMFHYDRSGVLELLMEATKKL